MYLDIQGFGSNFLNDPQICSEEDLTWGEGYINFIVFFFFILIYFIFRNFGTVGIDEFFKNHRCNEYCKTLGLPPNKFVSNLMFSQITLNKPFLMKKSFETSCLCGKKFLVNNDVYYNKLFDSLCSDCSVNNLNSEQKICKCGITFYYKKFLLDLKGQHIPDYCGKCKFSK